MDALELFGDVWRRDADAESELSARPGRLRCGIDAGQPAVPALVLPGRVGPMGPLAVQRDV